MRMFEGGHAVHRRLTACITFIAVAVVALGLKALPAPIAAGNVSTLAEEVRLHVDFYPGTVAFLRDTVLGVFSISATVLWDLSTDEQEIGPQTTQDGQVVGISNDLCTFAVCTASGAVTLWSADLLQTVADVCTLESTLYPRAAFSPDGRFLAITNHRAQVDVWELGTATLASTLSGHASNLFGLAFSPDGCILITAGGKSGGPRQGSCIKVWDASTWVQVADLGTSDIGDNHATAFFSQGTRLISGGNWRLVVWDTATWERVYESSLTFGCTYGLSVSPDERLVALAMDSGLVRIVDLATMRTLRDLRGPSECMDAAFSPDGSLLAASFSDGTVIIWGAP
jgi:WD40 repeat protein